MGTNFYFKIKTEVNISIPISGKIKDDILQRINWLLDEFTQLHIGKRSCGWNPVFQRTEYYSSVKEIENFYNENKEHLDIIDEYNNKYSLNELREELIDWNKNNNEAKSHLNLGVRYYVDNQGYEFSEIKFS